MDQGVATTFLYEEDFYGWTREQAMLLRAGRFGDVDFTNLIEELETLGRSEASSLRSSLRLIVLHLLKLVHQPERATRSWTGTIVRKRNVVSRLLKDSPGLKSRVADLHAEAYEDGRREAVAETGLPSSLFPVAPGFTLEQVRDGGFVPG